MSLINVAQAGVITEAPTISTVGIKILYFLLSVSEIIAIIALVLSGIMYFAIQGDARKMRAAKTAMTYSVLGVVMALGGMIAIKLIGQFFSQQ